MDFGIQVFAPERPEPPPSVEEGPGSGAPPREGIVFLAPPAARISAPLIPVVATSLPALQPQVESERPRGSEGQATEAGGVADSPDGGPVETSSGLSDRTSSPESAPPESCEPAAHAPSAAGAGLDHAWPQRVWPGPPVRGDVSLGVPVAWPSSSPMPPPSVHGGGWPWQQQQQQQPVAIAQTAPWLVSSGSQPYGGTAAVVAAGGYSQGPAQHGQPGTQGSNPPGACMTYARQPSAAARPEEPVSAGAQSRDGASASRAATAGEGGCIGIGSRPGQSAHADACAADSGVAQRAGGCDAASQTCGDPATAASGRRDSGSGRSAHERGRGGPAPSTASQHEDSARRSGPGGEAQPQGDGGPCISEPLAALLQDSDGEEDAAADGPWPSSAAARQPGLGQAFSVDV